MRKYYILGPDSDRDDLEAVDDYEVDEDFDLTDLWTGMPFKGKLDEAVEITLMKGGPTDVLGNPLSWLIVSKRFASILSHLQTGRLEIHPVSVRHKQKRIDRYVVLNPLSVVDAVSNKRVLKNMIVDELRIDPSRIKPDEHLFRLKGSSTMYIVSDRVAEKATEEGLEGVAFIELKDRK